MKGGTPVQCPVVRSPKGRPDKPDIHAPSGSVLSGRFRTSGHRESLHSKPLFPNWTCQKKATGGLSDARLQRLDPYPHCEDATCPPAENLIT